MQNNNSDLVNSFASLHNFDGNWVEDFSHENGNYENGCIRCKNHFLGHKRRVICKNCYLSSMLDFYKPPFKKLEHVAWVYDSEENFVFQFVREYDSKVNSVEGAIELEDAIIDSLNSETYKPIENLDLSEHPDDANFIMNNGKHFILIRGWGNLTGINGHNLSVDRAAQIQDNFGKWFINKLMSVKK